MTVTAEDICLTCTINRVDLSLVAFQTLIDLAISHEHNVGWTLL